MDQDLTYRTEQAALGAMITSAQMAARLAYLEPADFTDLRNRWMYRAVRVLGDSPSAGEERRDRIARVAGGHMMGRSFVEELVAACPDPGHGPAYGAMLVQATTYRMAREHADQIDARAALSRAEGRRLARAGAVGADQAAVLGSLLADTANAIRGHTAMLAPPVPAPAEPGPARSALEVAAGQTSLSPDEQQEEDVLSALMQGHSQAKQIFNFLSAAAFTSPVREDIYVAARRLHQVGRPADELTVSWELAIRSASAAVVSPATTPATQVPDGLVARLASADIDAGQSPLQAARALDAGYRASHPRQPAAGAAGSPDQGARTSQDRTQQVPRAPGIPLARPQQAAGPRPADPRPQS